VTRWRSHAGCQPTGVEATPAQLSVHNNFCDSIKTLKKSLLRSIYYLGIIKDRGIHKTLGYKTILDYAAEEVGIGHRQCKAFLALSCKLKALPELSTHLESGSVTWRQAQEICRIASPETEQAWIDTATRMSVRELESTVRQAKSGGTSSEIPFTATAQEQKPASTSTSVSPPTRIPPMPIIDHSPHPLKPIPADTPHYVTYKFTTEQYTIWEAWLANTRKRDATSTKEALLCDSLTNGTNTGGQTLRTVIHLCPGCKSAVLPTSRGDLEAPRALLARARCDGECQHPDGRLTRVVPPRMRREVLARDGQRCRARGCRYTRHLEIHHIKPVATGSETTPDNLITLCSRCHRALHEGERKLEDLLRNAH